MDNDTLIDAVARQEDFCALKSQFASPLSFLSLKSSPHQRVLEAMRRVDRKKFVPQDKIHRYSTAIEANVLLSYGVQLRSLDDAVYLNMALPIGYGQTCSQPSLVACMTGLLELRSGMSVLEIGTGSGYQAAVLGEMIGPSGRVVTIETIAELAESVRQNLRNHDHGSVEERVKVITGDGSVGFPEDSPYDAILVTAGVALKPGRFEPGILARQVPNGVLVYPEQEGFLFKEKYKEGRLEQRESHGRVSFVPLQGENA